MSSLASINFLGNFFFPGLIVMSLVGGCLEEEPIMRVVWSLRMQTYATFRYFLLLLINAFFTSSFIAFDGVYVISCLICWKALKVFSFMQQPPRECFAFSELYVKTQHFCLMQHLNSVHYPWQAMQFIPLDESPLSFFTWQTKMSSL